MKHFDSLSTDETIMKKLLASAFLFVATVVVIASFITPTIFGQAPSAMESKPLIDVTTAAKVDKLFAQWDKPDSPDCALGIVKDGRLIYKRGYGMANLDHSISLTPKSVFDIGSMVKQFIGMSILILERQGKLSRDDEIQKYLPEIPRYQSAITIRHLIHHSGGIRSHYGLAAFGGLASFDLTDKDVVGLIARQKELNHKPGEEFLYTDTGYLLLGLIVQNVSGKSVHDFADDNIFKPLGMTSTILEVDRILPVRNRVTGDRLSPNRGISHRGEMDSTVEDLFLWDQNFYNNKLGGGPDLIREQVSTGVLNNGEKINYAVGLNVREYKGLKTIGHGGGGGVVLRFPEQNFSVICLCNVSNVPSGLGNKVADIFLADQFRKVPDAVRETVAAPPDIISIPEKELANFAGLYFDHITETTVRYYMKDGKLMIFNTALSPLSPNRFKVVGGGPPGLEIVFARPIDRGHMQVKHVIGGKTQTWEAVQSVSPTTAQLAEFAGKYVSDELAGATYTLSIKDGKLIMQVRRGVTVFSDKGQVLAVTQAFWNETPKDILLTPEFADAFVHLGGSDRRIVRFTRNQQNTVSGFTLSNSVTRRLRFNKQ